MIKVGVLGASGYAGADLVRLLVQRDDIELKFVGANSQAGLAFSQLYPNLFDIVELDFEKIDLEDSLNFKDLDVLFCALPHKHSQEAVKAGVDNGVKVVDLSADFRLKDINTYEKWYQTKQTQPQILQEAVYGLPELRRDEIKKANVIANPGCFPTAMLLGLLPLIKAGYTPNSSIISNCMSGISGAGRSLKDGNLFTQAVENTNPYSVGVHRHTPEVVEQLNSVSKREVKLTFVPHLVPMERGLMATMYVANDFGLTQADLDELYQNAYQNEPFVRVLNQPDFPKTKAVTGSNYCDIAVKLVEATDTIVIVSAIDNLIKGAAGQAMQNMNIMLDIDETKGLEQLPMW